MFIRQLSPMQLQGQDSRVLVDERRSDLGVVKAMQSHIENRGCRDLSLVSLQEAYKIQFPGGTIPTRCKNAL